MHLDLASLVVASDLELNWGSYGCWEVPLPACIWGSALDLAKFPSDRRKIPKDSALLATLGAHDSPSSWPIDTPLKT